MSALRPQRGEISTPAPRLPKIEEPTLPPLKEPAAPQQSGTGLLAEVLERLRVVEEHLGITPRTTKPFEPLPGSDVRPLSDEG